MAKGQLVSVESGCDWYDASYAVLVLLTDKSESELLELYKIRSETRVPINDLARESACLWGWVERQGEEAKGGLVLPTTDSLYRTAKRLRTEREAIEKGNDEGKPKYQTFSDWLVAAGYAKHADVETWGN